MAVEFTVSQKKINVSKPLNIRDRGIDITTRVTLRHSHIPLCVYRIYEFTQPRLHIEKRAGRAIQSPASHGSHSHCETVNPSCCLNHFGAHEASI